jgi:Flp pilus assembly protein TadD
LCAAPQTTHLKPDVFELGFALALKMNFLSTVGPPTLPSVLNRLRVFVPRSVSQLALLLAVLAVLVSLGWLGGGLTQRAGTIFLPHRSPAEWILYPSPPSAYSHLCAPLETIFKSDLVLREAPTHATLRVAAFRQYSLAINGVALDTSLHAAHNWKQPEFYEVSKDLRRGTNQIAVRVFTSNGPPALWLTLEAGGTSLFSGENWQASCAGATWRPARLAAEPPADPVGSPLHWTGRVGDCWRDAWPMLVIFSVLSGVAYWLCSRRQVEDKAPPAIFRRAEVLLLLGLAVLWTALFANDLRALPGRFGFDSNGHIDYVRYILERKSFPTRWEVWEGFQPPFYYLLCAGLAKVCSLSLNQESGIQALRWLGLPIGVAHIVLVWTSLRFLFGAQSKRGRWGLLLAAVLPALLCLSQYVSNEGLSACLMSASVCLTLRLLRKERITWQGCAGLGVCLGLAILTKATAVLLLPLVFGVLLWRWLEKRPAPFLRWAAYLGLALALCLPACAWHYTHFFGAPHVRWQDLGYTTCSYFVRFGRSLICPWFAGAHSFADGVYSTLWADGLLSGRSALQFGPPWNYSLMEAGCWLALAPSCAVILGGALALKNFIRQPTPEWFLILGLAFLALLALVQRCITSPNFANVKAFYALGALVPFCAFGAWGFETLAGWCGKAKPVLYVLAGVWAATSFTSFWILPSSSSSLTTRYNSLISAGHFTEAAELLREKLQNGPEDGQLRAQLAYALSRAGDWPQAAEQAQLAIRERPGDSSGHLTLATALASQRQMAEAIVESRRAVELAPGDSRASEQLASLYLSMGRLEEGIRAARDSLGMDPFNASLRCSLAKALAGSGQDPEAMSQLELAARMVPQQAEPEALLGLLLAKESRPAEAEVHFLSAIRLQTNNAGLRLELAKAFAAQSKFGDAATAAAAARDLALAAGQKELANAAQQLIGSCANRQGTTQPGPSVH